VTFHTGNSKKSRTAKRNKDLVDTKRREAGECLKCGYNNYWELLTFHHRDKANKSFNLSGRDLQRKGIQNILKEIEKCDILCPNCHGEEEHLGRLRKMDTKMDLEGFVDSLIDQVIHVHTVANETGHEDTAEMLGKLEHKLQLFKSNMIKEMEK